MKIFIRMRNQDRIEEDNQVLKFNVLDDTTKIDIEVRLGKAFKPGELSYERVFKRKGNQAEIPG